MLAIETSTWDSVSISILNPGKTSHNMIIRSTSNRWQRQSSAESQIQFNKAPTRTTMRKAEWRYIICKSKTKAFISPRSGNVFSLFHWQLIDKAPLLNNNMRGKKLSNSGPGPGPVQVKSLSGFFYSYLLYISRSGVHISLGWILILSMPPYSVTFQFSW